MITSKNFWEDLSTALHQRNVNIEDIEFIKSLIEEDTRDANLLKIKHTAFAKLEEKNLLNVFHDICKELSISWHK